jgi:hypothetical protein
MVALLLKAKEDRDTASKQIPPRSHTAEFADVKYALPNPR